MYQNVWSGTKAIISNELNRQVEALKSFPVQRVKYFQKLEHRKRKFHPPRSFHQHRE